MGTPLSKDFFKKEAFTVAKSLLGAYLVRKYQGKIKRYMITEIEVYDGFEDRASHAYRGKTPRNTIMFGDGGYWYVYFIYGMYYMLNITTGKKDHPSAILIRGVLSPAGKRIDGPGKLTRELKIDKTFNTKDVTPDSGLWIEKKETKISKNDILSTPRIGVTYAGPKWASKPYRYVLNIK